MGQMGKIIVAAYFLKAISERSLFSGGGKRVRVSDKNSVFMAQFTPNHKIYLANFPFFEL